MKAEKSIFKQHVFVCTFERETGESCGKKGSLDLMRRLKVWAKSHLSPDSNIRINPSGCLGQCEQGIACVIYPKGDWRLNVKSQGEEAELQAWIVDYEKEK